MLSELLEDHLGHNLIAAVSSTNFGKVTPHTKYIESHGITCTNKKHRENTAKLK